MSNNFNPATNVTGEVTKVMQIDFENDSKAVIEVKANKQYYTVNYNEKYWEWLQKNIKRGDIVSIRGILQSVQKGDKLYRNIYGYNPESGRNLVVMEKEENIDFGVFSTFRAQAENIQENEQGEVTLDLTVQRIDQDEEQVEEIHPATVHSSLRKDFLNDFKNGGYGKFKTSLSGATIDKYAEKIYAETLIIEKAEKTE